MGSNQQPLEYNQNAFPTELRREICIVLVCDLNFYCTAL